jgi:predicted RNase H-like HicB family nuclease
MIDLPYSLVIEATHEPDYFGFFSPELQGFTGIGHSIEDCLYKARWGMRDHVALLMEKKLSVPPRNENPTVTIRNEKSRAAGAAGGRKRTHSRAVSRA